MRLKNEFTEDEKYHNVMTLVCQSPELLCGTLNISVGLHSLTQYTNNVNEKHKIYLKIKTY